MKKRIKKLIAVSAAIMILMPIAVHAKPAYPTLDVPMEQMSEEMKDALIRSVITEKEEIKLAKMLYGEERQHGYVERAAVIWHTFNRVDSPKEANSVDKDVTTGHYSGYKKINPVKDWAVWVVRDVAWRYACEKEGYADVGRVLPKEYCYNGLYVMADDKCYCKILPNGQRAEKYSWEQ